MCQVREQKEELVRMVRSLGGSVVERDEWDSRVTHVIARVGREGKETMSEKVMAALAGGRWVVTRRFVDRSYRQGSWIASPRPYVVNDAVLSHRQRIYTTGTQGAVFWGMRAVLVMGDLRKNAVYSRVITAGGGMVVETSLQALSNNPPSQVKPLSPISPLAPREA